MKLLIFDDDAPRLAELIRAIFPDLDQVATTNDAEALREVVDADAMYGRITPELLAAATRLRWIQSPAIGLEHTMFPDLIAHPVVMTNPRGIFADTIADHVMALVTGFARQLPRLLRQQLKRVWSQTEYQVIHLPDCTLGIVGLGGIGAAVAHRAAAFGMRVIAVDARRTDLPDGVAELWLPDQLHRLLAESDFVVICAPETPETRGLFGAREFKAMKRSAYLINIGRGKIVRLDPLVEALRAGEIAGAGLDVFEVEPLPASHPLWDMENVVITPHVAGVGPHIGERRHQVLFENLRRFLADEPLLNVVDKSKWF
jgi:phosphoglycerate dehydrogenase-like enzyme